MKPRIRTVKPEMWQSRDFLAVPLAAQILFICLINHADDDGRLKTDAQHISTTMLRLPSGDIKAGLDALENRGMISQYRVEGEDYVALLSWAQHQKVDHPRGSDYPPPPIKRPRAASRKRATDVGTLATERADSLANDREDSPPRARAQTPIPTPIPTPIGSGSSVDDATPAGQLVAVLAEAITVNGSKPPTTKGWLTEADRLLRLDGRSAEEAENLIRWSQDDPFWKANILSMAKFRQKYDTLRLQRDRGAAPSSRTGRALAAGKDWADLAERLQEAGQ